MDHVIKMYFELVSEGLQTSIAALGIPKAIVKEDSAFENQSPVLSLDYFFCFIVVYNVSGHWE